MKNGPIIFLCLICACLFHLNMLSVGREKELRESYSGLLAAYQQEQENHIFVISALSANFSEFIAGKKVPCAGLQDLLKQGRKVVVSKIDTGKLEVRFFEEGKWKSLGVIDLGKDTYEYSFINF